MRRFLFWLIFSVVYIAVGIVVVRLWSPMTTSVGDRFGFVLLWPMLFVAGTIRLIGALAGGTT